MTGETSGRSSLDQARARLAAGGPAAVAEAVALARQAVAQGNGAARGLIALFHAAGVGMPQDWTAALDQLAVAAIGGSADARGQLTALAEPGATLPDPADPDPEAWRRLRAAVDPPAWTTPVVKTVLNATPRIVAIDAFLGRAACEWIITRASPRLAPARVFGPDAREIEDLTGRVNSAFEFAFADLDVVLLMVRARIAAAIGVPTAALEPPRALHFAVGQRLARHHDWLDPDVAPHAADMAVRGQRAVTFLIHLNQGFEGGEIHFPHLGLRRGGRTGDALYFGNLTTTGAPERRSLHEGLAPTSGESWVFTQWIRNRAVV